MDLPELIQQHLSAQPYFTELGIPVLREVQSNLLDQLNQALSLVRGICVLVESTDAQNTTQAGTPGRVSGTETIQIRVLEHVALNRLPGTGCGVAGALVARAVAAALHLTYLTNGPDAAQTLTAPPLLRFVRRSAAAMRVEFAEGAEPVEIQTQTLTFEAPQAVLCCAEDLRPAYHIGLMDAAANQAAPLSAE